MWSCASADGLLGTVRLLLISNRLMVGLFPFGGQRHGGSGLNKCVCFVLDSWSESSLDRTVFSWLLKTPWNETPSQSKKNRQDRLHPELGRLVNARRESHYQRRVTLLRHWSSFHCPSHSIASTGFCCLFSYQGSTLLDRLPLLHGVF